MVLGLASGLGRDRSWLLLVVLLVAACAPWQPAPVEDRRESPRSSRPAAAPIPAPVNYEVRRGDTLYSIAFRYGLDWREIAAWNRLPAPYMIRPGQSLRMTEPPRPVARSERPTANRPLPVSRPEPAPEATAPATRSSSAPAPAASSTSSRPPTRTVAGVAWRWPTNGDVARPFDASAARRGIGIRGQAGQQVVAAADGEVVYSGTALIGYGELIIIKHSSQLLSAYGHNRGRLVAEGIRVQAGQPIAEMGLDETDQAILHFEIRRNGQPENPLSFLPAR